MKFVNYAVVKFSICLTVGIVIAHLRANSNILVLPHLVACILLLIALWIGARKQLFQSIFFGSAAYLCFFLLGYFSYQVRLPQFQATHYLHSLGKSPSETNTFQLKIKEILKPDTYNYKYIVSAKAVNGRPSSGELLLYIPKDTVPNDYWVDLLLLVSTKIEEVPKPLNPHQFDYSRYMQTLGIHHQIRLKKNCIIQTTSGKPTLKGQAQKIRAHLLQKLRQTQLEKDQRAILQALVLGQKQDISKELYSNYAAAGAVHILAVSGLHVGILFFILSKLFSFIKRIRYGHYLSNALIILFLWSFAFITGLSPSVTRAVTMFSFFAFATVVNRQTSTINTLFLSYFVLLVINPFWLFQVGFQLSYLAVLSILFIQPKLYKYYRPKFYLDKVLWGVLTVSFAAQLGLAPLTIYYFHQFPGLFFITNMVVLPVLSILLGGGILLLLLASFDCLPEWAALTYNNSIYWLNSFIDWVARQELFLFKDIHFSEGKLLGSYLLFISILLLWRYFSYKKLIVCLLCFCLLLSVYIWDKFKTSEDQLVIFHKSRKTLLGYKQNDRLRLFRRDSLLEIKGAYPIKSYLTAQGITNLSEEKLPNVFSYKNETILVIDSSGVYPKNSEINVIILIESPKVNLDRLIETLKPTIIVADGSNYKSFIRRWSVSCRSKKLPFHHTGAKGAFIIE